MVAEKLEENDDVFVAKVVLSESPSLVVCLSILFDASLCFLMSIFRRNSLSLPRAVTCGSSMATATPLCIASFSHAPSRLIVFYVDFLFVSSLVSLMRTEPMSLSSFVT